jgi:hypothetical protein
VKWERAQSTAFFTAAKVEIKNIIIKHAPIKKLLDAVTV